MIDGNLENFATIVFAENESAEARISIFKELSPYAGNFFSGFELATTSLHSTALKNAVTLNFYLDDELIQSSTGADLAFSLVSSTLAGGYYKHLIGTISPSEFDEIQIVFPIHLLCL